MIIKIKNIIQMRKIHLMLISLFIGGTVLANNPMYLSKQTHASNTKTEGLIIENVVVKMIAYNGTDLGLIHHAIKVHSFARTIGKLEGLNDQEQLTLEIAAILHDIGIKESKRKYNSSSAKYQELEGPPVARELLKDLDLDKKLIDRVCFMIGNHHTYTKVDEIDFQILFEADFLVNMYESKVKKGRILEIQKKIFKTKSGNSIIKSML